MCIRDSFNPVQIWMVFVPQQHTVCEADRKAKFVHTRNKLYAFIGKCDGMLLVRIETFNIAGQYDAFVRALRKIYKGTLGRKFPMLVNYAVTIPPGGRTDAFVQTVITWNYEDKEFRTRGLDADQTEAAIKATIKMLNLIN